MPGLTETRQVGAREDLADFIAILDVRDTPFMSAVEKGPEPTNTLMQWEADIYADPKTTGTVDGQDVLNFENAAEGRQKLYNHVQIFRRTAKVSRLANDVNTVPGGKKELAIAIQKKLVEIKRDMESAFLSANAAQDDSGILPHQTRGMLSWATVTGSQPAYLPTPAAFCPASGQVMATAAASLVETDIQTLLKAIYDNCGMAGDYVLFCGSTLRRAFTDFTRFGQFASTNTSRIARMFTASESDTKVSATTAIFEGDYGTIELMSCPFIGWSTAAKLDAGLLVDMNRVKLRSNKPPAVEKLPDLGGGPRILIEAVMGLQVDNPKGLGKFYP